jgi:hypothetical protein
MPKWKSITRRTNRITAGSSTIIFYDYWLLGADQEQAIETRLLDAGSLRGSPSQRDPFTRKYQTK